MKIGSFCDIRACTASRFVASLESTNYLSFTREKCSCKNCFKIRTLSLTLMFCELSNMFFMSGSSSKIGRFFLITLLISGFCGLCVETYSLTFFRVRVFTVRSSFLSRNIYIGNCLVFFLILKIKCRINVMWNGSKEHFVFFSMYRTLHHFIHQIHQSKFRISTWNRRLIHNLVYINRVNVQRYGHCSWKWASTSFRCCCFLCFFVLDWCSVKISCSKRFIILRVVFSTIICCLIC